MNVVNETKRKAKGRDTVAFVKLTSVIMMIATKPPKIKKAPYLARHQTSAVQSLGGVRSRASRRLGDRRRGQEHHRVRPFHRPHAGIGRPNSSALASKNILEPSAVINPNSRIASVAERRKKLGAYRWATLSGIFTCWQIKSWRN